MRENISVGQNARSRSQLHPQVSFGFDYAKQKHTRKGCALFWSGKRDLNPRHLPWQGNALPLSYSRISHFSVLILYHISLRKASVFAGLFGKFFILRKNFFKPLDKRRKFCYNRKNRKNAFRGGGFPYVLCVYLVVARIIGIRKRVCFADAFCRVAKHIGRMIRLSYGPDGMFCKTSRSGLYFISGENGP